MVSCIRTSIIFAIVVVTTIISGYILTRDDIVSKQIKVEPVQAEADHHILDVQDKLNKLTDLLQHYQRTSQEQREQAALKQVHLNELITNLNTRLQSLEISENRKITKATMATTNSQQMTEKETNALQDALGNTEENPKQKQVSVEDLGSWIDNTLSTRDWDENATQLATEQATSSIEKISSNINIEDMQCNKSFCRATVISTNDEQPVIDNLFGNPPFMYEGFTISQPDGRVSVYFTQSDQSFETLRSGEITGVSDTLTP